ncbi:MAG: ORC-CDC6 family AAA ATPase [Devosia sp.]
MRFNDRAERISARQIAETFVSVGPVLDILDAHNNQIVYGRRGTGKTHALRYFQGKKNEHGDLAIYIDAQNIGSNGSIYGDTTLPVSERATRLLVDICSAIHHELLEIFTDPNRGWDLATAAPYMNGFVDSFTETRVEGTHETEQEAAKDFSFTETATLEARFALDGHLGASSGRERSEASHEGTKVRISGTEISWIDFSFFSRAIRRLANYGAPKRLWVLIDEWTTVPAEIQPYLADLIRRAMFSVPNISVKIAAIEHRAEFKVDRQDGSYIGFEVGADISAALNLDDYLVIDNDEERAQRFFRNFIVSHALSIAQEIGVELGRSDAIIHSSFTQENVFTEFVRASEGVPRDAMHILSVAAQRATNTPISMPVVRQAAYDFFQQEKYQAIQSNEANRLLLEWIRDEVIGNRRTRAFLLPVGTQDPIIDRLFDRRALHILNRSRSAAHRPGERFVVYKVDYGLYVDLVATDKFPEGMLLAEKGLDVDFDVPADDARSYRRAILDLDRFYEQWPNMRGK